MTNASSGPDSTPPEPEVDASTEVTENGDTGNPDTDAEAPDGASEARRGTSSVAELEDSLDSPADDGAAEGEAPAVSRELQLADQIERLQAEVDTNRDKWLRAMAEIENSRKRARRELESSINLARGEVLRQLLEVLDNFDRALDAFDQTEMPPDETFVKGVRLIQDQLLKVLRDNGVTRIEAVGEAFDPNLHEAVSQIETEDVPSQCVAAVIKEGYRLNDTVLRPAVVVVAQ